MITRNTSSSALGVRQEVIVWKNPHFYSTRFQFLCCLVDYWVDRAKKLVEIQILKILNVFEAGKTSVKNPGNFGQLYLGVI